MYKVSKIIAFLIISHTLSGQALFNKESEIIVKMDQSNKAFFDFKVANDNVLKALVRVFKLDEAGLRKFNKIENQKIENKEIKLPVIVENIVRSKTEILAKNGVYVPVFYYVKKGDTSYKLAKTYGKEDIETFMKRNKLTDPTLKINSKVNLGWFYISNDINNIKGDAAKLVHLKDVRSPSMEKVKLNDGKIKEASKNKNKLKEDSSIDSKLLSEAIIKKSDYKKPVNANALKTDMVKDTVLSDLNEIKESKEEWTNSKGIAYWQPSHRRSSGKYVLHSTAPINSIIKLYNPMMRRTVDAKVIGRIPKETYRKDVDVVISPAIAESLGALDSRFMVELTYKN